MLHLLRRESDEWLRGELRGRCGIFPSSYVQILEAPSSPEAAPALPPKTERPPPPTTKPPPPPVSPEALFLVTALHDYTGPAGDLSFRVSLKKYFVKMQGLSE